MRQWQRLPNETLCGGCAKLLAVNTAVITIKLAQVKRELIRCEDCIGVKAPPDLPLIELHRKTKRAEGITSIGKRAYEQLHRDWKMKQAGS